MIGFLPRIPNGAFIGQHSGSEFSTEWRGQMQMNLGKWGLDFDDWILARGRRYYEEGRVYSSSSSRGIFGHFERIKSI